MTPPRSALHAKVSPDLLRWAYERARLSPEEVLRRFPRFSEWETQQSAPTLKQLERYAVATRTPLGYFFLDEPPIEKLPIPDLRTMHDEPIGQPSPDMLDVIYACQQRQDWYRDHAVSAGELSKAFVGSVSEPVDSIVAATHIRETIGFDVVERAQARTWSDALRSFIDLTDAAGVLVMVSGVVGNNTHRPLKPDEFRGFALSDNVAPLIFINGADTKAAQMFTLAHELAHIFLGQSALDDIQPTLAKQSQLEQLCNQIAAELLVPLVALRDAHRDGEDLRETLDRLARHFKVSTLVILLRLFDIGEISRNDLQTAYDDERARLIALERRGGGGGDFYLTEAARVGKRFARAIIASTLEGQTLYQEAFKLLSISKTSTFDELGHKLGVA